MRKRSKKAAAVYVQTSHHLDRHANLIVAADIGADDELLSTEAVARWLGVSTQFLEIGRHKGYGPKFKKISTRCVRYSRGDVLKWLRSRTHAPKRKAKAQR